MPTPGGDEPAPTATPAADRAPTARRPMSLLTALAWMAAVVAAGMFALAALWPDDLGIHHGARLAIDYLAFMSATFLFHAGAGMAIVTLYALFARRRRLAFAAAALVLLCAGPEALTSTRAVFRSAPTAAGASAPDRLTLMSANLLYGSADPRLLLAEIARHRPDVIVFQEWTPRSAGDVKPLLLTDYPHWAEAARDDAFGQAVCSKRPFIDPPRYFLPSGALSEPEITVAVDLDHRPLRITDVHVLPPLNLGYFAEQREMASALLHHADTHRADGPQTDILAGDFNAVPRSSVLARARAAGLIVALDHSPRTGRWRATTWPRDGTLVWAPGIRLDHILHSPGLRCTGSAVCADVASDHAPIVATFERMPAPAPERPRHE